jgi:hypothetical protein
MDEQKDVSVKPEFTLYRTSDIYFSAFLCALDVPLQSTESDEKGDNRRVIFVFKVPSKDLQRFKALYFGGQGTVKAQKFVQSLRSLKSMCFI